MRPLTKILELVTAAVCFNAFQLFIAKSPEATKAISQKHLLLQLKLIDLSIPPQIFFKKQEGSAPLLVIY
jgi:hypothetical protein